SFLKSPTQKSQVAFPSSSEYHWQLPGPPRRKTFPFSASRSAPGTSLDAVRCETPQLRGGSRMILPPGRVAGPAGADSRGPSAIPPSEPRIEITANAPARTTASTPARAAILRRRPVLRPVFEPRPRPACVESDTWTSPVDVYVSVSAPPSSFFIVF